MKIFLVPCFPKISLKGEKVVIKKYLLKLDGRNISEWSETLIPTMNGRASWRHH